MTAAPTGPLPVRPDRDRALPGPVLRDVRDLHGRTGPDGARDLVGVLAALSRRAGGQATLGEAVDELARGLGADVLVLDREHDVLAAGTVRGTGALEALCERARAGGVARAATARRAVSVDRDLTVVAPVRVADEVAGWLVLSWPRDARVGEDLRLLVAEHAAAVAGVILGRERAVAAATGRARQHLVEALLNAQQADPGDLGRWARHLGLDPAVEHYVLVVALEPGHGPADARLVEAGVARACPDAVTAASDDEVVVVVPVRGSAPGEHGAVLARRALAGVRGVAGAGVGGTATDLAALARSCAEARRALDTGMRLGAERPVVTAFSRLGIHRLFANVRDVAELRAFADGVLGPLAREDTASGTSYVATVAAYFDENCSPQKAAKRLHVHANTVTYRLRRAEVLTGLDLADRRDRLMTEVAVEVLRATGTLG